MKHSIGASPEGRTPWEAHLDTDGGAGRLTDGEFARDVEVVLISIVIGPSLRHELAQVLAEQLILGDVYLCKGAFAQITGLSDLNQFIIHKGCLSLEPIHAFHVRALKDPRATPSASAYLPTGNASFVFPVLEDNIIDGEIGIPLRF